MEEVSQIRERYGKAADEAADFQSGLKEAAERLQARAQSLWDDAADLVREHPAAALGIALAGGALVGSIAVAAMRADGEAQEPVRSRNRQEAKESLAEALLDLRTLLDQAIVKLQ